MKGPTTFKTKNNNDVLFFPLLEGWRYENTAELQDESQTVLDSITKWSSKTFPALGQVLVPMI